MNIEDKKIKYGCSFLSGYAFKSSDFSDEGIPVIKIANIQNKVVRTDDSQRIPFNSVNPKIDKFFLKNGDVLIAMTGQGSVGRVGKLILKEYEKALINQRVGKFTCDEVHLNKDYLFYVISSKEYEKYLFDLALGSGQPNLSPSDILNVEIPFPDYQTQKRIAEILTALDDKIELNRRMNQTLEQMAQTLYQQYFVNDIDEDNLPEGWQDGKMVNLPHQGIIQESMQFMVLME
jgi:type I restriction enzyme, S subunit